MPRQWPPTGSHSCRSFFRTFTQNFYNVDVLEGTRISKDAVQASGNVAAAASARASFACVATWETDFRADLERIDVPRRVIHGDADRIVPLPPSGQRTHQSIAAGAWRLCAV